MKECVCLFSSYPQLTNKDQVSLTNERSSCLTAFESVVVTYCEIKHHFAMHSIALLSLIFQSTSSILFFIYAKYDSLANSVMKANVTTTTGISKKNHVLLP